MQTALSDDLDSPPAGSKTQQSHTTDPVESGGRPVERSNDADVTDGAQTTHSTEDPKKQPNGVAESSQLNVNAPAFHVRPPTTTVKQARMLTTVRKTPVRVYRSQLPILPRSNLPRPKAQGPGRHGQPASECTPGRIT